MTSDHSDAASENDEDASGSVKNMVSDNSDKASENGKDPGSPVKDMVSDNSDRASENGEDAGNQVKNVASDHSDAASGNGEDAGSPVKDMTSDNSDRASENGEDAGNQVKNVASDHSDAASENGEDAEGPVKTALTDKSDDTSEKGKDAGGPVKTVIIDEEEEFEANTNFKDNTAADESILNRDDFDDGGSTPKSGSGHGDEDKSPLKKSRAILGSDSDDSDAEKEEEKKPEDVEKVMNSIFGEDSSDDGEGKEKDSKETQPNEVDSDDADAKFLRLERDSDDNGHEWDFDKMLKQKKAEKRRRRKHKGDSILLISDSDDQIKALVDKMHEAAAEDRASNQDKRPAIQKRKMLPTLRSTLMKADLFETLLDNGMMSGISEWLAPLPDKSLPALEVRSSLLKILEGYPSLDQGILKQSGLGKAVMFLFKHPKETRENKTIAAKLIREWSRPIFQLDTDFRSLSRDERVQRDLDHMPVVKRRKLSIDADGLPTPHSRRGKQEPPADETSEKSLNPGQIGFVNRARVPKPSTKDYVVRPRSTIEGRFQGPSKNRQTDRFDKAQREFNERNRAQKAKRAVGVSIEGRKMDV